MTSHDEHKVDNSTIKTQKTVVAAENPSVRAERNSVNSADESIGNVSGAILADARGTPSIGGAERVEIRFPKRKTIYYSVTDAEITAYAQFGRYANICLTLFGLIAGVGLGCMLALVQGNIPDPGKTP